MNNEQIGTTPDRLIHDGGSRVKSAANGTYITLPLDYQPYPAFVARLGQSGWGDLLEFPDKGIHIHALLLERVSNKLIYYCK
jgi:hypothetical protein